MEPVPVIVVTGGTKGIGLATARSLADAPFALVLAYRHDESAATSVKAEFRYRRHPVEVVRCDVASPTDAMSLFDHSDQLGPLAGLVNCAGYAEPQASFEDITPERWARILTTNVIGTATCCREAVTRMKASPDSRRPGEEMPCRSIVNLSSRAAELGAPGEYVDYAASKAAVDTLTRGLALEVAPYGIRVNSVRPGIITTDFHATAGDPGRAERLAAAQPLGRAGAPEEVAEAITWLLSDKAAFTTGSILDVSGGR